jgi:hypothetical protein
MAREVWFAISSPTARDHRIVLWKGWVALVVGSLAAIAAAIAGLELSRSIELNSRWAAGALIFGFALLPILVLAVVVGRRTGVRPKS